MAEPADEVDEHVDRWRRFFTEAHGYEAEVEGAVTRMQLFLRRSREQDMKAFAGSELTWEDYQTLHTLMVQPYPVQATPAQLAEALHVTRATVTSRLDRLVDAALVTREVDPTDRRRIIVRPTAAGRAAWQREVHQGMARDQALFASLDLDQLQQLNDLLRRLVNGL